MCNSCSLGITVAPNSSCWQILVTPDQLRPEANSGSEWKELEPLHPSGDQEIGFRTERIETTTEPIPTLKSYVWQPTKERLWLHILLFVATIATTSWKVSPTYSFCLMSILTAHEFGHYLAARYYRVPATLPYFIPAFFFFGTMGAVIRMSPHIPNRRALFDIASAGPLAGMVVAVPISFIGILLSERIPLDTEQVGLMLGDPVLFQIFERIIFGVSGEEQVLLLHDVGFAGWVGLFVTALNLLPIGQLDGGHVTYAVFGSRSLWIARAAFVVLLVVCLTMGQQYALFLILLLFMGLRHGPTQNDWIQLGSSRKKLALILLAVFALCFIPVPISFQ